MIPTQRPGVTAFLRARHQQQTAFLAALVRMPSDNPPGDCDPHARATAELLEGLGFTVERHPVPTELARAHGMISATNLVVRRSFSQGGPVVALNAHGDVVPPGEGWTADPYGAEIRDGWMIGRGVAVSKSDIATYAFAMLALAEAGRLRGTVELHVTYDEESGGEIGPAWVLQQGISKPDIAIGAGFSYGVTEAHNGCLHLEVEVTGRSAHAARPFTGVAVCLAQDAGDTDQRDQGYRCTADDRGADCGWHQHQRGAGSHHVPAGSPHRAGGSTGRRRGRAARCDRRRRRRLPAGRRCRAPYSAGDAVDADTSRAGDD